ncbi:AAA family ATPase [Leptothermofonsia sp. ETS-13]|uniref:AAA family ATPase n=1 Tax=Leptothermofonsia sp. ETS-13 TaxID=3035696 RepID=UPI003B9F6B0C
MEILSVTLKNFKRHRERQFFFQPGINAIFGENGAGKSSILEAIAWVLFDYIGGYSKEDLICNGSASAQVSVSFVSNRDGRTYEIQRCTTRGYTLYDSQLNERLPYSKIKEEVLPWLRQHLGVTPGTDLGKLFASTIGVPQGTFTADFLLTKENRKPIFDKILKVEEYQQTWKKMGDLEKYARSLVENLEREIAGYDKDLEDLIPLQQKREAQHQEIEQVQTDLQQLQLQLTQLQAEQTQLVDQATQIQRCQSQLERLTERIERQLETITRLQTDLRQAEQAVAICTANREAYQTFVQAEETFQALQQQWQVEQQWQREKRQYELLLSDRKTQLATLTHQLEELAIAEQQIKQLEPQTCRQLNLEQQCQNLSQQFQTLAGWQQTLQTQEKLHAERQNQLFQLQAEIFHLQALESSIQQIPMLEQQQQRLQQQLSRIEAATQFKADLQQILSQSKERGDRYLSQAQHAEETLRELQKTLPLWTDALDLAIHALHSGADWQQQLTIALHTILNDLTEQTCTAMLEQQLKTVHTELQILRRQQTEFSTLKNLLIRQQELENEIKHLQVSLAELRTKLAAESTLKQELAQVESELQALNDPRGQIRLLTQKLEPLSDLQQQFQKVHTSVTEIQQKIAKIDTQLAEFANLADAMQTQQSLKERHQAAYQEYLAYRELANTRKERQKQLEEATHQLQTLKQEAAQIQQEHDRLTQSFDPVHFQSVQAAYQQANTQQIALKARLPDMQKYLDNLDHQLARLQTIQEKRSQAKTALEQRHKTEKFIKFARKVYKEAGPRITERYVQTISREADCLFRELLNRVNVSLEWTRDYEIIVREGAHSRRFINLSGGEQMCAALAVRLALLKVLADIDVAFFDEPTTNMDRPRRESLAEAIANIKTFRQLFVISHDDTFEKVTENIILVEREAE